MRTPLASLVIVAALGTLAHRAGAQQQSPTAEPAFEAVAALASAKLREFRIPGAAVGILHDGSLTVRGLGVTNVDDPLPVTEHTVFPIASISKTFAATALLRLVEQGKVDLHATVQEYLRRNTSPSSVCKTRASAVR